MILIIGSFHHKNKEGLERILIHLNYDYKFINNINDIIFSPCNPIDTSKYLIKHLYLVHIFQYYQIILYFYLSQINYLIFI